MSKKIAQVFLKRFVFKVTGNSIIDISYHNVILRKMMHILNLMTMMTLSHQIMDERGRRNSTFFHIFTTFPGAVVTFFFKVSCQLTSFIQKLIIDLFSISSSIKCSLTYVLFSNFKYIVVHLYHEYDVYLVNIEATEAITLNV